MSDTTSNYDAAMESFEAGKEEKSAKDTKAEVDKKRRLIRDARNLRSVGKWDERFSKFIQIYSNKYPYPELSDYDDVVVPNMVFSTVNVIVPSIAINNPKIEVRGNSPEDEPAAETATAVVNYQWDAYDVQNQVRSAIKDFVIVGHGWLKVVWESEEKEVPLTAEEFTAAAAQALAERSALLGSNPDMESEVPTAEELVDSLPAKKVAVTKDQPLVKRVSPFDVLVDPDATCFEDVRWVAQRSFVPIEVARKNEDWDKAVRSRLVKVKKSKARDDVDVDDESEKSDIAGFAEIYEFYDLISGQMCVFADGTEGYLLAPEDSPFPGGHPFVFVPNYEVPERFFPIGDVETIYPLQLELGLTRTAQLNDRKRGRRITLFKASALDADGIQALRDGQDNVMINVTSSSANFDEVFKQVSSQGLQPEWYRADSQSMSDIDLVSGVTEYQRGGQTDIRRTATEVGVMQDASNARSADKLAKVEKAMAEVAERMIRLSQQFMDTEAVARVVSEEAAVRWVPYSAEALQGDFSFRIEAGSSQPQNESFKRQMANQMMDTFGQFIGSGYLNDQKFLAQIMRLNGWANPEEYLGPGPPPMGPDGQPLPPEGEMPPEGGMPPGMPPEMMGQM